MSERETERESLRAASEKSSRFDNKFLALLFPLLYCFIDGLGSFLDAFYLDTGILEENVANLAYEFTFGICAFFSYLYLRFVKKERFSFIGQKDFCIAAACETAGQFTYIHALGDNAVVAAPLISSYCVFSVMLSRLILKEKLRAKQYIIIAALVSGIVILGYFDV
jgi:drug/metabolite transporter (DMT)-like permease